jgi:tRNA dimethylallyltransferase
MKTLVVILGPTGVGKTEKTLAIAEQLKVPVINADSRQIFKEIPIGSAAPTKEQRERVKHYFVGSHSIHDYYSAAQYEADVIALLDEQFRLGDYALMSGGSMMYIDAVCKGIDDIPTVDKSTRELYKQRFKDEGLESLLRELETVDPEHYAIVDRNNPRRVIHALEICHMTGKTYTSFRKGTIKVRPFNIIKIGLNRTREEMYDRINSRVLEMIDSGLEKEARSVYPYRDLNALNTVGFKEMFQYFDGVIDIDEAIRRIQSNTRRYMRKQITWFNRDDTIHWYHPDDEIIIK